MDRITNKERTRFHKILDESIDKMNSPKNANKIHWKNLDISFLQKHINVENAELELAVHCVLLNRDIESENFDLINLNLMMIDNIRGNK